MLFGFNSLGYEDTSTNSDIYESPHQDSINLQAVINVLKETNTPLSVEEIFGLITKRNTCFPVKEAQLKKFNHNLIQYVQKVLS